ncbi:unannotated protein [freshwater metagenome]|uniref:Unannotated protein n=1 Tax=freshwater metagenome TaxID=449393 RepID=A0A6J7GN08_9ZZZZ|nr:hypothetical protein [Actinomycetota bacterium]
MTAFTQADWEARMLADHQKDVAQGHHDGECEYGRRWKHLRVFLCHCHKRKREAAGHTEVPTEDLYFPPPSCPRCSESVDHDGDVWNCPTCALSWSSDGSARSCTFTDDYGDAVLTEEAPDAD